MQCKNCGYSASIEKWKIVETSSTGKIDEKLIKEFEKGIDEKEKLSDIDKNTAKVIFRTLSEMGIMPIHKTQFFCPTCGSDI